MKTILISLPFLFLLTNLSAYSTGSKVIAAKLFQNNAEISRTATVTLSPGKNIITLTGLPSNLKDSTVKAMFPDLENVKIISLQVEQSALIEKRNKQIKELEAQIESLEIEDSLFVDQLKLIDMKQRFLSSLADFSTQKAEKDLQAGSPNQKSWKSTLSFMTTEMATAFKEKRRIEKERVELGKKIQDLEYKLSTIAGYKYFNSYQNLRKEIKKNRQSLEVQDYTKGRGYYENLQAAAGSPGSFDTEKQLIIECVAPKELNTNLLFSYQLPGPRWNMSYDLRVDLDSNKAKLEIYSQVYQQTGEDWNEVKLLLSTAKPRSLGRVPYLSSWSLDEIKESIVARAEVYPEAMSAAQDIQGTVYKQAKPVSESYVQNATIKDGLFFEVTLPETQNIRSLNKPQKRLLRAIDMDNIEVYFELKPAVQSIGYRKMKSKNQSEIDWLRGNANLYLDKQSMGNFYLPYTAKNAEQGFELGEEERIVTNRKVLKKVNESSGLFGGDKKQSYEILLTAENKTQSKAKISLQDIIPVSQSDKIKVDIDYMGNKPQKPGSLDAEYARGLRKWNFSLNGNQKKEFRYKVTVTYAKDVKVRGLR